MTAYVRKLIEYPEALQVVEFAEGLISLIVVRAVPNGAPGGADSMAELPQLLPRHAGAHRGDLPRRRPRCRMPATATRASMPSDEVFVLAATSDIRRRCSATLGAGRTARSSA